MRINFLLTRNPSSRAQIKYLVDASPMLSYLIITSQQALLPNSRAIVMEILFIISKNVSAQAWLSIRRHSFKAEIARFSAA
jgi:hypothetical protein